MVHDEIDTTTNHMGLAEATKEMPEWDGQNYIMVKIYVILALAQAVIYKHCKRQRRLMSFNVRYNLCTTNKQTFQKACH